MENAKLTAELNVLKEKTAQDALLFQQLSKDFAKLQAEAALKLEELRRTEEVNAGVEGGPKGSHGAGMRGRQSIFVQKCMMLKV